MQTIKIIRYLCVIRKIHKLNSKLLDASLSAFFKKLCKKKITDMAFILHGGGV
jgi:hypothetical protein